MKKINFKGLGVKTAGLAIGAASAGFVQKGIDKLGLTGIMADVAMIAVGALGPDLIGKKDPLTDFAGTAIMTHGIKSALKRQFPSLIAGVDDDTVAGYDGDYEVGDAESFNDVEVAGIVCGPDLEDDSVAGTSSAL